MELVVHPSVHKTHTMKGKLKLIVCTLSGDTMKSEVFRSTLPVYCSTSGDPLLKSNKRFMSRNGLYSVVKGKLGNLRTTTKSTTTTSVDRESTGTRTSVSAGNRKLKIQSLGRKTTALNVNKL